MSLVRFLLYSNQFDVEGLVATTSTWMKARVRPDVILSVLDAYEKVQPNLLKHAPGFPTAAALRAVVAPGQPAYGMEAVGDDKTSPGAELILRAAERADPRPLWVLAWGGTNTLAQALRLRAVHANAGAGRGPRREAARLHDLRPGRRRPVDPPRVPEPALRRDAVHAGRRGVLLRDLDGHQRRPLLPQRARGGLHHVHRRVGEREHPEQGAARASSIPSRAASTRATRRRSSASIDNGLASAMSPAYGGWGGRYVWRQPSGETRPFWTQGGDSYPGRRQLARHGGRRRREGVHVRPGDDLALADGVPARLRGAHGLDDQGRRRGEPQPDGRGERPAGHGAPRPRRAGRHARDARRRGHDRPRRRRADVHVVLLSRRRARAFPASRSSQRRRRPRPAPAARARAASLRRRRRPAPSRRRGSSIENAERPRATVVPKVAGIAHVILAVEDTGTPSLTSYRRIILKMKPAAETAATRS